MSIQFENWVSNPDETHGPLMSITTWTLGGVAFGFMLLRYSIRHTQKKLWIDDLVLGTSWVLLLAQLILNQLSINLGFGKHALDIDFANFERITYYGASALSVSIAAMTLSKISFGVTLLRLTEGWYKAYVWFAIATLAIFAIPAAVLPWVLCKPLTKTFVDILPGTCIDKQPSVQYGRFQAVWAAIMDLSLALLPWKIIWNLQLRFAEKIGVGVAMSLGILAGAAAIVRARYVELLQKQDLSYEAYNSVIWSLAETSMTIIATCMPVLRVFFKQAVNTAISNYHNSSSRSKSKSTASHPASQVARDNARRSGKMGTHGAQDTSSTESLVEDLERGMKRGEIALEELVVDEKTGRVTMKTPDSIRADVPTHNQQWPL